MSSTQNKPTSFPNSQQDDQAYSCALYLRSIDAFSHALATCQQLDLFDIIAQAGPAAHLTAAEITAKLPAQNPDAASMIDRMLRLLACYSLLTCSLQTLDDNLIERRYGLSPTGGNPFEKAHGVPMYKYISSDQESVKGFNKAMDALSSYIMSKVLDCYNGFQGLESLVDVGGGSGVAINMVISKYPSITAINFDLPHVVKEAPPCRGVKHVGGDMFSGIPSAHAIMMKEVLHNWSDEHCIKILKNCYDALQNGGKVIVELKSLVDVGGGSGVAINMVISKYPSITAINFDLSHVVKEAPTLHGVKHVGGDMFSDIPSADAIMMKEALHNWSDEHCIKILKNCYDTLQTGGKVIVVSHVMPEVMDPSISNKYVCQLDLMMFAFLGEKRRTRVFKRRTQRVQGPRHDCSFFRVQIICYAAYNAVGVVEFYK
ncbi:hypothetical protein GH714_036890 [Hevea brasiliensis]|uniref:O-methyltransferase domain-containing protein n=1 Tax=Hevea brasiliensis TaxID=3981 RepID=A0A6A6NF60_HEVBR|nr:hypothetical protein GH714_036890 [Hevea brasiliensis]